MESWEPVPRSDLFEICDECEEMAETLYNLDGTIASEAEIENKPVMCLDCVRKHLQRMLARYSADPKNGFHVFQVAKLTAALARLEKENDNG